MLSQLMKDPRLVFEHRKYSPVNDEIGMIVNGRQLTTFITSVLSPFGFVRNKDNWYFITDECICMFHCSKSIFRGKYEPTLAGYYKKVCLPDEDFPVYYKANVRYATNDLTSKDPNSEVMEKAFNLLDTQFKGLEREDLIRAMLEDHVVPFLKMISTGEGIKKASRKYKNLKYRIDIETREALSIKC
jgi:hypothetical protein